MTGAQPGVYTLRHGTRAARRSDVLLGLSPDDEPSASVVVDYYLWAIVLPERTIVVDTGFTAEAAARRGRTVLHDPIDLLQETLGLAPAEITDVVLTHAHYDHIGNVRRLPCARMWMAEAERRFARETALSHRFTGHFLEADEVDALRDVEAERRLRLVATDTSMTPGVRILTAPGHTPGQLMVLVDTARGGILLASDALHFREELTLDLPFASTMDVVAGYRTFERIEALEAAGARVIPGHDSAALDGMERLSPDVGFLPL
jgi:glyoxylase-like metal-dependent hydrolase (beta-lactamase superfamily II)